MGFRRRSENELDTLDDEALIAYIRAAAAAGQPDAAKAALRVLVQGYEENVRRRMAMRVPPSAVEDCAQEALIRAITAAFDGSSVGEFRSWLSTIIERTRADYFRRESRRPPQTMLPEEHQGDEDAHWQSELGVDGGEGAAELWIVIHRVLDGMKPEHREVVMLHVISGLNAEETCARVEGMKPDNVAKIASRFRQKLELELDGGPGEGPA